MADEIANAALSARAPASDLLELGDLLAAEGLLPLAVSLWRDVVTHPGVDADTGIAAAQRLVAANRRDDTIAALREALAQETLVDRERADLRARLAWTVFVDPNAAGDEMVLNRSEQPRPPN